ncbi:hypothetical protein LF1_31110 [Rubripirellula obstinata]|uniref:Uncharacterized protein n=2 Tax=Rubripirellula obstinata TaxID=406547 RepID=A0A5B1CJW0_9BACT|nr:hypothetical protein LF1_31110 [Rubripirellula obstinata]
MQRDRYFCRTVLISISFWLAMGLIPDLLLHWLGMHRFFPSSILVSFSECRMGLSTGLWSAFCIHIAIWWLWRCLNTSSTWILLWVASLSLIPTVFQLGSWIAFYDWYESDVPGGAMPFRMIGVSAISGLLIIPWCLVTVQLLSPVTCLRLRDCKVQRIDRANDRNWSIQGLMLLTFLVAVDLTIRESSNQMIREHFKDTVVNFDPGNSAGLLLLGFLWRVLRVSVIVLAGWAVVQSAVPESEGGDQSNVSKRGKRIRVAFLAVVILLGYLTNMLYLVLFSQTPGDLYLWSNTVVPTFLRKLCDFTAVYFVSVWIFRRWEKAGYQIEGSLMGWGTFPKH